MANAAQPEQRPAQPAVEILPVREVLPSKPIRPRFVPDEFFGWRGRGIGIFISLIASLLVIAAGLFRAGDEL